MDNLTDIELVGELWRKRIEWMWKNWNAEYAPSKVDIEWLDEQIIKDEARDARRQAPKG